MAKQIDSVKLSDKVTIQPMDEINFRDNLGAMRTGTISRFWDRGDKGWMTVLDEKGNYEVVSIAVQLEHIPVDNIIIKKAA